MKEELENQITECDETDIHGTFLDLYGYSINGRGGVDIFAFFALFVIGEISQDNLSELLL